MSHTNFTHKLTPFPKPAVQPGCALACCENPSKRANLARWRVNRLRRLEYDVKTGRATERQRLRALHLQMLVHNVGAETTPDKNL